MTTFQLQGEIKRVTGDIGPQMCGKVISNFEKRIIARRLSASARMDDVVLHMQNGRTYSAVHNSGATLRNFSIFLFQAIFIHLYELCIYMLYIFVKGMLQVI